MLPGNVKFQFLHTLPCVEAIFQFEALCAQVLSMAMTNLNRVILVFGPYFFLVNALSKQNFAMRRGMKKPV